MHLPFLCINSFCFPWAPQQHLNLFALLPCCFLLPLVHSNETKWPCVELARNYGGLAGTLSTHRQSIDRDLLQCMLTVLLHNKYNSGVTGGTKLKLVKKDRELKAGQWAAFVCFRNTSPMRLDDSVRVWPRPVLAPGCSSPSLLLSLLNFSLLEAGEESGEQAETQSHHQGWPDQSKPSAFLTTSKHFCSALAHSHHHCLQSLTTGPLSGTSVLQIPKEMLTCLYYHPHQKAGVWPLLETDMSLTSI